MYHNFQKKNVEVNLKLNLLRILLSFSVLYVNMSLCHNRIIKENTLLCGNW